MLKNGTGKQCMSHRSLEQIGMSVVSCFDRSKCCGIEWGQYTELLKIEEEMFS